MSSKDLSFQLTQITKEHRNVKVGVSIKPGGNPINEVLSLKRRN